MSYDAAIDRSDASALMPEDVARDIIQGVARQSYILSLATRLPDMPRKTRRMPVLSVLPTAYFVNGDTGLKQTTEVSWQNKFITAEEIAVIVPVPNIVLDDSAYDIWGDEGAITNDIRTSSLLWFAPKVVITLDHTSTQVPDNVLAGLIISEQIIDQFVVRNEWRQRDSY